MVRRGAPRRPKATHGGWRRKGEQRYARIVAAEPCVVGFRGESGITHTVAVDAESVFEAAVRALSQFQRHLWLKAELTLATVLLVQLVRRSRTYRVQVRRLLVWFDGAGPDRARRFQLKPMLDRPQDSPRVNKRIRAH